MNTKIIRSSGRSGSSASATGLMMLPLMLMTAIISSCSHHPHVNADGPYWKDDDNKGIAEPSWEEPPIIWTTIKRTSFDQAIELMDADRNVRKIFGNPTQAKNTNCFDEVPNSSWFTNRHGHPSTRMTSSQIAVGPSITSGPDTSEVWNVFKLKSIFAYIYIHTIVVF